MEKDKLDIDNYSYILIDLWGTVFIESDTDINIERAKILYQHTKKHNPEYWYKAICEDIKKFKKEERKGLSIKLEERIKELLLDNNVLYTKKLSKNIINKFDDAYIKKCKPHINRKLINLVKTKKVILASNTGLVSTKCINNILQEELIDNIFYKKFYSENTVYCKPNPKFISDILDYLHIKITDCIFIGNSYEMDYKPCKEIGIKCYIKDWSNDNYDKKIIF